jgi:hypothetical protein
MHLLHTPAPRAATLTHGGRAPACAPAHASRCRLLAHAKLASRPSPRASPPAAQDQEDDKAKPAPAAARHAADAQLAAEAQTYIDACAAPLNRTRLAVVSCAVVVWGVLWWCGVG